MNRIINTTLLASLACCLVAAEPKVVEEIRGKVVNVVDGDTVTLKTDKELLSIRLEGIDAPEKTQSFGTKSKDTLKELVATKDVVVRKTGVDKYKRTLGIILVDGQNVSAKMVGDGWAWHFKKYSTDENLAQLETEARAAKRGLWADPNPLPPWEFRDRKKDVPEVPVATAPATPKAKQSDPVPAKVEAKFWLNSSTGVRHNSRCQHFANTKKGHYCSAADGKACGQCGG